MPTFRGPTGWTKAQSPFCRIVRQPASRWKCTDRIWVERYTRDTRRQVGLKKVEEIEMTVAKPVAGAVC